MLPRGHQSSPVASSGPLLAAESPPGEEKSEALANCQAPSIWERGSSDNPAEPVLQVSTPSSRPGIPKGCIRLTEMFAVVH